METFDLVIIGGGVVGSALAQKAVKFFPGRSIGVLEKNSLPGLGASSRNSGVLHSPFQQPSGSLKAKFATRGRILARDFANAHEVPLLDECGMILAVPTAEMLCPLMWREGVASLWKLFQRGKSHNMDFRILTRVGIKKLEPNIRAGFGVFIPSVSVIDPRRFVEALEASAKNAGARFFYNNEVEEIHFEERGTVIATHHTEMRAKVVINAAGLYADDIANMALGEQRYRQYPRSGEYYEVINPEKKKLVSHLVYPVVSPKYPGKGIHFGPRPNGQLFLGPNAHPMASKTFDHEKRTPPDEFLKVANAFGAGLLPEDIVWSYYGIRPTLSPTGEEKDFHVGVDSVRPLFINNIGIASPGISSAMALAEYSLTRVLTENIL